MPVDPEFVRRVVMTLDTFVGQLHAATWIGALLAANETSLEHGHAVKYGLQMTSGAIVLTVRKFHDMWRWHVKELVPEGSPGWHAAAWILGEAERRNLRDTANQIVAHFGEEPGAWPLSNEEILALIQSNGWDTEQDVMRWGRDALHRLLELRDEIIARHGE
jgi:hypothetical protein